MFDTMIFNRICDGLLPVESLKARKVFITPVQREELRAAPTEERKAALFAILDVVDPRYTPAAFTFDIAGAGFDQGVWSDNRFDHKGMLASLRRRDKKPDTPKTLSNQTRDILIAEAALRMAAILVSDDGNLRDVMIEFGGSAISSTEFRRSNVPTS